MTIAAVAQRKRDTPTLRSVPLRVACADTEQHELHIAHLAEERAGFWRSNMASSVWKKHRPSVRSFWKANGKVIGQADDAFDRGLRVVVVVT